MAKLTGERPLQGVTPDSLLALHDAGYRGVIDRLGAGLLIDVGCGEGFESVRFIAPDRDVIGVDYSLQAVTSGASRFGGSGLRGVQGNALDLPFSNGAFDYACSSHLIEHFVAPEGHVSEISRVLAPNGTAFFITPNATADFENPFHIHLFTYEDLEQMLGRYFDDVWIGGMDPIAPVKADFAARRAKAEKLLALDFLKIRKRIPHAWYVGAYTRLLPLAYRLIARSDAGGGTGITADDFSVEDHIDDTTMVLFAVARKPR